MKNVPSETKTRYFFLSYKIIRRNIKLFNFKLNQRRRIRILSSSLATVAKNVTVY